jgi:hypothetical protein
MVVKSIENKFLPEAHAKIEKSIREQFSGCIIRVVRKKRRLPQLEALTNTILSSRRVSAIPLDVRNSYVLEFAPQERIVSFDGLTRKLAFPWMYMSIGTNLFVANSTANASFLSSYYHPGKSGDEFTQERSPLRFDAYPTLLYFSPHKITDPSTQPLYAPWVPNVYRGGVSGEESDNAMVPCLPAFPQQELLPAVTKKGPSFNGSVIEPAVSAFGASASRFFTMDFNYDNMERIQKDSPLIWKKFAYRRNIFTGSWHEATLEDVMSIEEESYGKPIPASALFGRAKNARDKMAKKKDLP